MAAILSIGSLRAAGTTTLALALSGAAAANGLVVTLVDAAAESDLMRWADLPGRPDALSVVAAETPADLERRVRAATRRSDIVIIDAGRTRATIEAAARLADRALVPLRLSPLSAIAAVATDTILAADAAGGRRGRDRRLVATQLQPIPSRIARQVEAQIDRSSTPRLSIGLAFRAAYDAPFLFGGTVHTLAETAAPGILNARRNADSLAADAGIMAAAGASAGLSAVA